MSGKPAFDLAAYFARIGIEDPRADVAGLFALQEAQMRAIPFENFDPLLGKEPALGIGDLCAKLVAGGRGGYCFELNLLFGAALLAAGFAPRRMLGRVRMRGGVDAAPRSHLMLRVEAEGRAFLADAGFGGPGPLAPVELLPGVEQQAPNGVFRVVEDHATGELVLERLAGEGWMELYGFDGAWVSDGEIEGANYICATWDAAPFSAHAMLAAYAGDRRIGLFDRGVTVEGPAGIEQRQLKEFEDFRRVVQEDMGIGLDAQALSRAWEKLPPSQ